MPQSKSHSAPAAGPLILVADDDRAVRESLQFLLELEGLEVRVFDGGPDLLAEPRLADARCIVLDYRMAPMDGLAIMNKLKALGVRTPVILIAAHATDRLRRRAADAGISHIIEKPLLDTSLADSIRNALRTCAEPLGVHATAPSPQDQGCAAGGSGVDALPPSEPSDRPSSAQ